MTTECENQTNELNTNPVENEGSQTPSGREISQWAAALDSRWKTRAMLDH